MCTDNWLIPANKFLNASCMTFSFRPSGSGCWKASHWCETKMASPLSRVYSTSKPCSNDTSWLLTSWMARKLSSGIVNMGKSSFSVAHSCCFSGARTASANAPKLWRDHSCYSWTHIASWRLGDWATGNRKSWRSALNARFRFLCRYMSHVFQVVMCHMCATGAMHSHICIHMSCAPLWFLGYIFIPYLHSTSLICIFQDMHVSLMLTSMFQDMHVSGCFYIILSSFRPFNMLHRSTAKRTSRLLWRCETLTASRRATMALTWMLHLPMNVANCCPATQPMKWHPFVPVSRQFSNHKTVCVLLEWIFAKWQKFEGILWSLNGLISESACWGMIPCDFHDVSFMALKYPECHHFQQFPETVLSLVFKILRRFFYTHHLLLQASNTRKVSICINTSNQKTSKKVPLSLMFTTKPPRPLFAWLWSLEIRALHLHISHIRLYNLITY